MTDVNEQILSVDENVLNDAISSEDMAEVKYGSSSWQISGTVSFT